MADKLYFTFVLLDIYIKILLRVGRTINKEMNTKCISNSSSEYSSIQLTFNWMFLDLFLLAFRSLMVVSKLVPNSMPYIYLCKWHEV